MIKQTGKFFALSLFALASLALPVHAEEFGAFRVKVPFAFRVGSVTLPAGDYNFVRENQAGVLRIAGRGGSIMMITRPGRVSGGTDEPSVAFRKTGGTAVLEQLRMDGVSAAIIPLAPVR